MQEIVWKVYNDFDKDRKKQEALQADKEDILEIEKLEKDIKNIKK
jgi:hypothetical protein